MLSDAFLLAVLAVVLALFFDFTNGFHDSANQVATVIASNALSPPWALILAAISEFIGAYFLGTAVAETIGRGIVNPAALAVGTDGTKVIIAALVGAILWNLTTWYLSMPSSSSHALVGGLIGAFLAGWGTAFVNWPKVTQIVLVMIASPLVGFIVAYIATRILFALFHWTTPGINRVFRKLQIVTMVGQAMADGTNDAQKTMGVITFVLIISGFYCPAGHAISVPGWVVMLSSLVLAIGTLTGGWRIIKTLGNRLYRVRPIHAFSSQAVSGVITLLATLFGFPISTTQVISSAVIGAGAATRLKMVRWMVAHEMVLAWFITIPVSAVIAWFSFWIISRI